MVFFEADAIWDYKKHIGESEDHDGIPNVEKFAEWHYDEEVDAVVLLCKPEFRLDFVVLQSLRVGHRVEAQKRNVFVVVLF